MINEQAGNREQYKGHFNSRHQNQPWKRPVLGFVTCNVGHQRYDEGQQPSCQRQQKHVKIFVIVEADCVVDKRTKVIKEEDAFPGNPAIFRTMGTGNVAHM